nr:hypothetical protein [Acinetobacter sp. Marseille-Q1620]
MPSITHQDLYTEVRAYLLGLFHCDVVQGQQNGSPLPKDGIVMMILFEKDIGTVVDFYEENEDVTYVQGGRQATLQLDFYGDQAQSRASKVALLWKNQYSTSRLRHCQPLYGKEPQNMNFINEQSNYETRWMLELVLQYNPETSFEQTFLDQPLLKINPLGD